MIKILKEPHPFGIELKRRVWVCVVISAFVFLFLYVFRPFGLSELPQGILQISAGYGLTCFVTMALLNIGVVESAKNLFAEERWTVGKELIWITTNIFFVGIANTIYSSLIFGWGFNLTTIITVQVFTLSVGVIPSTIVSITNHNRLKNKYIHQAQALSKEMGKEKIQPLQEAQQTITIQSENKNEGLTVSIKNLLFIRAADNYIEVFYTDEKNIKKQILRNTLKQIENETQQHNNLLRCHKSYLVNLENVKKISGNAQGYKLHLEGTDEIVPVSRNLNSEIKQRLFYNSQT